MSKAYSQATCVTSNELSVRRFDAPTITTSGGLTVCTGGDARLTAFFSGGAGTCTVQWQSSTNGVAWVDIPGADQPEYQTPALSQTTLFRAVYACDASGCAPIISNTQTVTVVADPDIVLQPNDITQCVGGTAPLSVQAQGGTPTLMYQWQISVNGVDWNNISGATLSTYTPLSMTPGDTYYRVLVSTTGNGCGSVLSGVATVTILNDPTVSVSANRLFVCANEMVALTGTASGGQGAFAYQWEISHDGLNYNPIAGATAANFSVDTLTVNTYFRLSVNQGSGCDAVSAPTLITVDGCNGTIGDFVFWDCNGSGVQSSGVLGVPNVSVTLFGRDEEGNNVLRTTVSDASGAYRFTNVRAGNYQLRFSLPNTLIGVTFAPKNQGGPETDSDVNSNGETDVFAFRNGQNLTNIDAGLRDVAIPILIGAPADAMADCHNIPTAPALSATDNTGLPVSIRLDETRLDGVCANTYTLVRTWTATDACGNTTTATQRLSVRDITAPTLLNVPADVALSCSDALPVSTVTAVDLCDVRPTVTVTDVTTPGACAGNRTVVRTFTATDACGNTATATQNIVFTDNIAPILANVPRNIRLSCTDPLPTGSEVTATDNCDNAPRITMADVTQRGTCAQNFTILRTFRAIDACGNVSTATQVIEVGDFVAPNFTTTLPTLNLSCEATLPTAITPSVSDACDPNPRVVLTETTRPGACANTFTRVRTWTATDACGNSATLVQDINVSDLTPPTLVNVPANVTFNCTDAVPTAPVITATDACDVSPVVTLTETRTAGTCGSAFNIVRTWTATDACGNQATARQTLQFIDNVAPIFANVPANINLACGTIPPVVNPTITDNCDRNPVLTLNETTTPGACSGSFTLTRTWTATDACGNVSTATQTIVVQDNVAPVLANVPADLTVGCGGIVPVAVNPAVTDNCDINPRLTLTETRTNGACAAAYILTRTWTATDACGNTTTARQIITVGDQTPPVFVSVPANISVGCGGIVPAAVNPIVTDNCDLLPRITLVETRETEACAGNYRIIRTWTATDACGNQATARQVISVGDFTPPTFVNVPIDVTIACGGAVPAPQTPVAIDLCDPQPRITFAEVRTNGACAAAYILTRTWTATDACGNQATATQTITVGDNIAPVFTSVPQNVTVACGSTISNTGTPTVTDNCDAAPIVTVNDRRIDGACAGSYTLIRTWTATDACGNQATASQTIVVGDNIAPIFANVPANVTINCGDELPRLVVPNVTDNCDATPTIAYTTSTIPGLCGGAFITTRTWTATDACGNQATASQVITALDTKAPVFVNVPADVNVNCDEAIPTGTGIQAMDDCAANLLVTQRDEIIRGTCTGAYTIVRTWTAIDACGNTSTASQRINVGDFRPPVFSNVPQNITVSCGQTVPAAVNPLVRDVCDTRPVITFNEVRQDAACAGNYTLTRTWTATDACGNVATATQTITVGDVVAPTLVGVPSNVNLACLADVPTVPTVTATDACSPNVAVTFNETRTAGACLANGRIVRTWTATDACGNVATATQTIAVNDTIKPVLAGVPANLTVNLGLGQVVPTAPSVSATDNCDALVDLTFNETRTNQTCGYTLTRTWTATDDCGNRQQLSQTITVIDELSDVYVSALTPENCENRNGAATLLPATYTYVWSDGQTAASRNNLAQGTYTVTVSNAAGCSKVLTINVLRQCVCTTPIVSVAKTNVSCASTNLNDGQATLAVSIGTVADYRYTWIPNVSTSHTASNLAVGTYQVLIEKIGEPACVTQVSFRIEAPTYVTAPEALVTKASCAAANGTARFNVQPTDGLTFRWNDGSTLSTRSDLQAGVYTVTVSSANTALCPVVKTVVIDSENPVQAVATVLRQPSCGLPNGQVRLEVSGGSGNYTFSWNGPAQRTDLAAGVYAVTVTDAATNCTRVVNFVLENQSVTADLIVNNTLNVSCNGLGNGRINYTFTPGNGFTVPATIEIRDANNAIATNGALRPGNYTITVKDAAGCLTNTANFSITEPTVLTASAVVIPQTCDFLGTIQLNIAGGNGNYTVVWNDGVTGATTRTVGAGLYTATVTDVLGCQTLVSNIQVNDDCLCRLPVVDSVQVVAATCGSADGAATLILRGGNPQLFNFDWTPNTGLSNALNPNVRTGLSAGTYDVRIVSRTNAACFTTKTVAVGSRTVLANIPLTQSPATCNLANGQVAFTNTNFTYKWAHDNQTVATRTDLAAGTYQVLVTDPNAPNCPSVVTVTVTSQNPLTATANVVRKAVCGDNNGQAIIQVQGGSGDYTYSWGATAQRTDLAAAIYVVTVTDRQTGCTALARFVVESESVSQAFISIPENTVYTSCGLNNDGNVRFQVTYGNGFIQPALVQIVDNQGAIFTNGQLTAGNYFIVVKDGNNCIAASAPFAVVVPTPLTAQFTAVNANCTTLGSVAVTVSGGTTPLTYRWSDGGFGANRTGLAAGTYGLTVTDVRGCAAVLSQILINNDCTQNPCTFTLTEQVTNKTCVSNGQISLIPSSGRLPYTFDWADLAGTDNPQNRTNLSEGVYTVIATDANGCKDTVVATVSNTCNPVTCVPPVIANTQVVDATCGVANGTIAITATEATGLLYIWTPNISTTNSASGLAAGVYRVKVVRSTDAACFTERTIVVNNNNTMQTGAPTIVAASCAQSNGSVRFATAANLRYDWSDGVSSSVRTDLAAGNYFVTVTDLTGVSCSKILAITVPSQNNLTATATVNRLAACGQADGQATINVVGGSGSYTYSWGATAQRTDLRAGVYNVTVTDNQSGCTAVVVVVIENNTAAATLTLESRRVTLACAGDNTGGVIANVTYSNNFALPARIEIRNAGGQLVQNNTLAVGQYTYLVYDNNGCLAASTTFEVVAPAPIQIIATPSAKTCSTAGSINLQVVGGSGLYTFSWSDLTGSNQPQNRINLAAGNYAVTVTDSRGCSEAIGLISVADQAVNCQSCAPFVAIIASNQSCTEGGSINVLTTGGTAPFTFDWADIAGTNDVQNRTNLTAGTYTLIVTDATGCKDTLVDIIIENGCNSNTCNLTATATAINADCNTAGSIALQVGGGVAPYRFDWSDIVGSDNSQNRIGLLAGTYTVIVTDAAACSDTVQVVITNICNTPRPCTLVATATPTAQNCFTTGQVNVAVSGGTSPYTFRWADLLGDNQPQNRVGLTAGLYTVTVSDVNGCKDTLANIQIINTCIPTTCNLIVDAVTAPKTCTQMGSIQLFVSSGRTPYTFSWSDLTGSNQPQNRTNLAVGTYRVTVTDGLSCDTTLTINIIEDNTGCQPACTMQVQSTVTARTCAAGGGIVLNVVGGVAPYRFDWTDLIGISNPQNRTNLAAGTYSVVVVDNLGCRDTLLNIFVDDNCLTACTVPTLTNVSVVNTTCGQASGSIQITGAATYNYTWTPNVSTTNSAFNLAAGTYRVRVAQPNTPTCFIERDIVVNNVDAPVVAMPTVTAATCAASNGRIAFSDLTLTYAWSDGGTGAVRNNIAAGTYTVTVTSAAAPTCPRLLTVTVGTTNNLTATAQVIRTATCGQSNGEARLTVSGGSGNYSYSWGANNSRTDLSAQSYSVTVSDNETGCSTVVNFAVNNTTTTPATITADAIAYTRCAGSADARVNFSVLPATLTNITITQNGQIKTNGQLSAGQYSIEVRDANGCLVGTKNFVVQSPSVLTAIASAAPRTCTQTGSIALTVTGGTGVYSYVWSDLTAINQPQNRTNLTAGNYAVTATDANGCSVVVNNITVANQAVNCGGTTCNLVATAVQTDVSCTEAGAIRLTVTGGNAPYTFDWSDLAGTVNPQNRTNLTAGVYTVVVSDAGVCKDTLSNIRILNNCAQACVLPILNNINVLDAQCGTASGSIALETNGNYGYTWLPNIASTATATNLTAGTYKVRIFRLDNPNCFIERTIVVNNVGAPVVAQPSVTAATCSANDGIVAFNTPSTWTFQWSDGGTGRLRTDLAAGSYVVTVTDPSVSACPSVLTVSVGTRSTLTAALRLDRKPSCGQANGQATLIALGGSGNYTYSWGTAAVRNNLSAGFYSVTVTDIQTGCTAVATLNLTDNIVGMATITMPTTNFRTICQGQANATAIFTINQAIGFVQPATVEIRNGSGVLVQNGSLAVGNYTITVKDGNGCVAGAANFTVSDPTPIVTQAAVVPMSCTTLGSITLTTSGGNGGYSFNWADITGTNDVQNRTNLLAGDYNLTVTDSRGCTMTGLYTVLNNCTTGRPTRDTLFRFVTVNKNDTVCLRPDVVLAGQPLRHTICGGGTTATLNAGAVSVSTEGCIVYRAGAMVGKDTFCIVSCNSTNLCDTTIIITSVTPAPVVCRPAYYGPTMVSVTACDSLAQVCTDLSSLNYRDYTLTDNGRLVPWGSSFCRMDTTSAYTYFSLLSFYPNGPWFLSDWTVNGRSFSANISSMTALKDSMNRWDNTGNWLIDTTARAIIGGNPLNTYGNMTWTRNNLTIATFRPNRQIVPNGLIVSLDTGRHFLTFRQTTTGCVDTVTVMVNCPTVQPQPLNTRIDTIVTLGNLIDVCLRNVVPTAQTTLVNACSSNYRGFVGYAINDVTDCIRFTGVTTGVDSFCIRRCYLDGRCDTTTIVVRVKPFVTPSDTACQDVRVEQTTLTVPCGTLATVCTNLFGSDTLNYNIYDNGRLFTSPFTGCTFDTISSYSFFSLLLSTPIGPWKLDSWAVENRTFSGTFRSITALVDSMNHWDPTGNWRLELSNFTIKGGYTGRNYGSMFWSKNRFPVATVAPNRHYNIRKLGLMLTGGLHTLIFENKLKGCRDTVRVSVACQQRIITPDVPQRTELLTTYVGEQQVIMLGTDNTPSDRTRLASVCTLQNNKVRIEFDEDNDVLKVTGVNVGQESICVERCSDAGCDTILVNVTVTRRTIPTPETVVKVLPLGEEGRFCVATNQVFGTQLTLRDMCESNNSGKVNFILNGNCVTYLADNVGIDTACLELCDNFGYCDTTYLVVQVTNGTALNRPKAVTDRVVTRINTPVTFEVLKNDSLFNTATRVQVLEQPKFGSVRVNGATGTMVYTPQEGDCEPRDSFRYVVTNNNGTDTAWVSISIVCDEIVAYTGFSPNNDGINDAFTIIGIEKYPVVKLTVFNRWGQELFRSDDYKNDWMGTSNGKPLPDGTYFWMLDIGTGTPISGYVQLNR